MSLSATVAELVRERLSSRFPRYAEVFSVRAERFSHGGAVDVRWIDGPPERDVASALHSLSQEYRGSIYIDTERRFSEGHVRRVAEAFCACQCCPVPEIEVWANGAASV